MSREKERVTWIPWNEEHDVLAKYEKNCAFCQNPATFAACTKNKTETVSATIRCCDNKDCRVQASQFALAALGTFG